GYHASQPPQEAACRAVRIRCARGLLRAPPGCCHRRPYNTQGAEVRRYDDDESSDDSGREYEDADAGGRRRTRFFSQDMLDPPSMDQLLSLMEDRPAPSGWTKLSSSTAAPRRGWWVAKEDDDVGS
ncbi:hypothetical protein BRADI_1g45644v3, partial [Brachypodium distachyon]